MFNLADFNFSDYELIQENIYKDIKDSNKELEYFKFIMSVVTCSIALFGILGNVLSIIILVCPQIQLRKFIKSSKNNVHTISRRIKVSSSFYMYLTALSVCDLFSCMFAIINLIQFLMPSYANHSGIFPIIMRIMIYTQPIAYCLQALSCWLVCAFSIYRCITVTMNTNLNVFTPSQRRQKCDNNQSIYFKNNRRPSVNIYFCSKTLITTKTLTKR
jgi:hypothetical protein